MVVDKQMAVEKWSLHWALQALAWLAAHARAARLCWRSHGVCPKASVTVRSSPEVAGPKGSKHMHSGA